MMQYHRPVRDEKSLCIMFSGGLDSLIASQYAQALGYWEKIVCIHLQMGQPYSQKEKSSVLNIAKALNLDVTILDFPIISNPKYDYPKATLTQQIIPGRNFTLAVLGANFGRTIWINALLGELVPHVPDKNSTFFHLTSAALSHAYGEPITVESPFWNLTKGQTVKLGLELGIKEDILKMTSSCYHENEHHCGKCGTCFKRKAAMIVNDIYEEYTEDPFESDYAKKVYDKKDKLVPELLNEYEEAYVKVGKKFVF